MSVGPLQIIIIIILILLFFGPKRLPSLAKSLGESIRGFKKSLSGEDDEDTRDVTHTAKTEKLKKAEEKDEA